VHKARQILVKAAAVAPELEAHRVPVALVEVESSSSSTPRAALQLFHTQWGNLSIEL
jgi:hypothetical protein